MTDERAPAAAVLTAFGVGGQPEALPGGSDSVWRVGDLVLKRGVAEDLQYWLATAVTPLPRRGFRFAEPVPTTGGEWVVDGWSATAFVSGTETTSDWAAVVAAGRAFHTAVADLDVPMWIADRDDPWARADRAVWGDEPVAADLQPLLDRLRDTGEPPGMSQVVHGDLTRNVLLADGESPAIIDVSPYVRPASCADGIVIGDAMIMHGARATLASDLDVPVAAVAYGLAFRMLTDHRRLGTAPFERAASALGL